MVGFNKKRSTRYEMLLMNNGVVRSVRRLSSTEYMALNFNRIRTLIAGIISVNTMITDTNQSLSAAGKIIGKRSGFSIRAEVARVGIKSGCKIYDRIRESL
jgi:hypothetical protein